MIGTRGHPELHSKSVRNLIVAPVRRMPAADGRSSSHSVKPDQLYRDTEQLYAGTYVELFARRRYPGWDCWGNELAVVPTTLDRNRPDHSNSLTTPSCDAHPSP
jgi:N6-adenosine-specific RNA methylase IME4